MDFSSLVVTEDPADSTEWPTDPVDDINGKRQI